jgi:hypothetical protein
MEQLKKKPPIKKEAPKKFNHKEHWKGMPEFNQPDLKPVNQVLVNFQTAEDMHKFAKIMGQPITAKTRSIWYPYVESELALDKRWTKKK